MQQTETDEELLNRWFDGESDAFEEFFRRHSVRVINFCMKKNLTREDAEDVTQRTFEKLSYNIHRYEKGRPALPWLYTITHNELKDHVKRRTRYFKNVGKFATEMQNPDSERAREESDILETAGQTLSPEALNVLKLRLVDEKSFEEVSKQIGKNEATSRKIFQRAIDKLREWIKATKEEV